MQYFGELQTKYEEVFVTESYMYFNREDEEITIKELKQKIKTAKDRKKNIIGTVFIYNPYVCPAGYDSMKFLLDQDFEDFDTMVELKAEGYITVFKQAMSKQCVGKIVEIKNLFNLNEKRIDNVSLLSKFNEDIEKYNTSLNPEFDREIMYLDVANIIPNGKFVYFSWGEKINEKEFPNIKEYAQTLFERMVSIGKNVAFVYKREKTLDGAIEYLQFANPMQSVKFKNAISNAIKESFKEFPPTPTPFK